MRATGTTNPLYFRIAPLRGPPPSAGIIIVCWLEPDGHGRYLTNAHPDNVHGNSHRLVEADWAWQYGLQRDPPRHRDVQLGPIGPSSGTSNPSSCDQATHAPNSAGWINTEHSST